MEQPIAGSGDSLPFHHATVRGLKWASSRSRFIGTCQRKRCSCSKACRVQLEPTPFALHDASKQHTRQRLHLFYRSENAFVVDSGSFVGSSKAAQQDEEARGSTCRIGTNGQILSRDHTLDPTYIRLLMSNILYQLALMPPESFAADLLQVSAHAARTMISN
jgi:hypothetical protein